jgi:hypothetical protein
MFKEAWCRNICFEHTGNVCLQLQAEAQPKFVEASIDNPEFYPSPCVAIDDMQIFLLTIRQPYNSVCYRYRKGYRIEILSKKCAIKI